jgi:hypothetical protein
MTTLELYRKHKSGELSREKFLYEVRRDPNLPWVLNTTSYDDAVKILKNKGIITETKKTKEKVEPKPSKVVSNSLPKNVPTIDQVHPYEYRLGLQHELETANDYSHESLEKCKAKVLKNLGKDPNYYTDSLITKTSPHQFKKTDDSKTAPDGYTKAKGYKHGKTPNMNKTDKALFSPKEAEKHNPKDVKVMTQTPKKSKGVKSMDVPGKEKVVKEGVRLMSFFLAENDYMFNGYLKDGEEKALLKLIPDATIETEEMEDTIKTVVSSQKYNEKTIRHAVEQVMGLHKSKPEMGGQGVAKALNKEDIKSYLKKSLKETDPSKVNAMKTTAASAASAELAAVNDDISKLNSDTTLTPQAKQAKLAYLNQIKKQATQNLAKAKSSTSLY